MARTLDTSSCPTPAPDCLPSYTTPRRAQYFPTHYRRSGQSHRYMVECPACGMWQPVTLHADSKTTPAAYWSPSKGAEATAANAWALPAGPPEHGGSCASTTQACISCYAASMERYDAVARMVAENLASVRHVAAHGTHALALWLAALVDLSADEQRAQGVKVPTFRWHSDGDLGALVGTDLDRRIYPRAIRAAAKMTPNVQQWLYTREMWAIPYLSGAPNLAVLISADEHNLDRAHRTAQRHRVPLALLANDAEHARTLWDRIGSPKALECPATGRWQHDGIGPAHIVGPDGRRATLTQGEPATGACNACRACLPNGSSPNITFHIHGKGDRLTSAIRRRIPVTAA